MIGIAKHGMNVGTRAAVVFNKTLVYNNPISQSVTNYASESGYYWPSSSTSWSDPGDSDVYYESEVGSGGDYLLNSQFVLKPGIWQIKLSGTCQLITYAVYGQSQQLGPTTQVDTPYSNYFSARYNGADAGSGVGGPGLTSTVWLGSTVAPESASVTQNQLYNTIGNLGSSNPLSRYVFNTTTGIDGMSDATITLPNTLSEYKIRIVMDDTYEQRYYALTQLQLTFYKIAV